MMVLSSRAVHIFSVHSAGEIGDVIVGGVLDVPGKTMFDKMMHFWTQKDELRQLLLNEPRGRPSRNLNLSEEYAPLSGSNTICTTTALDETGMIKMQEPITTLNLNSAAGLVSVIAECEGGKCKNVAFVNVPAFVFHPDLEVEVPGLGKILCDIAWSGTMYAIVDMTQTDLTMNPDEGQKIVEYGERIKRAVQATVHPVHPANPGIHGVTDFIFLSKMGLMERTRRMLWLYLPALYARKQMADGESFKDTSIIGTEYTGTIMGVTKVGNYDAVLPRVKGSAWITRLQQVVLDPTDPFPGGFRVGDAWHPRSTPYLVK
ncbi:proline racemase [Penicillium malachiteum]|nr:proline racemase [Penicillium malachiteum]